VPLAVYIAEIRISDAIEVKIRTKHHLTGAEVREAFVLRRDVEARWEDHPVHGRRAVVLGLTYRGRRVFAALFPVDPGDGVWNLMTARPLP
jgi:hypothetical protein